MLDLETVGQEGVATRGIDHEARLPLLFAAVVVPRTNHRAAVVGEKIDGLGLAAFMHLDALARALRIRMSSNSARLTW